MNIDEDKRESVLRTWIQRNGVAPLKFLKAKDAGFVNIQIDIKPDDRESLLFVQAVIRTTGCKVHQQQVDKKKSEPIHCGSLFFRIFVQKKNTTTIMRSQELKERRNIAVCKRFEYLVDTLLIRADVAVRQMSQNEFFLAEKTIYDILREKRGMELPDIDLKLELDKRRNQPLTLFDPLRD